MLVSKLITHYMDSTYIVDIVREGVILDQGFEVEVGAIGGKEENAARDELIFGVVGLQFHASMSSLPHSRVQAAHLQLFCQFASVPGIHEDLAHVWIEEKGIGNASQGSPSHVSSVSFNPISHQCLDPLSKQSIWAQKIGTVTYRTLLQYIGPASVGFVPCWRSCRRLCTFSATKE